MGISVGIRGAGVAGLSLAVRLARVEPRLDITLFDTRPRLPNPRRTFCFFRRPGESSLVPPECSWSRVSFESPHGYRSVECADTPYVMVNGDAFFDAALAIIQERDVHIEWGCSRVDVSEGILRVNGEPRSFDIVVDAAFSGGAAQALLWQSFGGLWVTTDDDLFDPSEARLMEFISSTRESPVSFMYVLPTSRRDALVEHTTFSVIPQPFTWHREFCERWLAERTRGAYRVKAEEHGAIPMGLTNKSPRKSPISIGTCGGAVRPSTGYAFQAIQDQAESLARRVEEAIARGVSPAELRSDEPIRPVWTRVADNLFLRALLGAPEEGNEVLSRLVHRSPADKLVAFLAGHASFGEAMSVVTRVPWWTMTRGICASFR